MKLSVIIPTKDRPRRLIKLIKTLEKNKFFFNEIIIVDSSNDINKSYIKKKLISIKLVVKLINSKPSIANQRNLGIKKEKRDNNYIMFLDDDISFNYSFLEYEKFYKKK